MVLLKLGSGCQNCSTVELWPRLESSSRKSGLRRGRPADGVMIQCTQLLTNRR